MTKKERYAQFIAYFEHHLPKAETELDYDSVFHLLIAVILSAQCTDKRVNMTTPALFAKYPTPHALASATFEDVFALIKSISYPNSKANYLIDMAKKLVEEFNGIMPSEINELIKLPGVGRKTASVIRAVYFDLPAMPVDTHVFRVSARIGLTTHAKTPLETEKQLVKHIPQHQLNVAHHWLILHGRYTCKAIKPLCISCGIAAICSYYTSKKVLP